MSGVEYMEVIIRLPLTVLYEGSARRLLAESSIGSFGLLPNHVDFVSDLRPSILRLLDSAGEECLFGIDEGLLIKQGRSVSVVVRRGLQCKNLSDLRSQVSEFFLAVDDDERRARAALSRLEANMARRFTQLQRKQV